MWGEKVMEGSDIFNNILNYSWKVGLPIFLMLLFRNFINNALHYLGLRWDNKQYSSIGGLVKWDDGEWWEVRDITLQFVKLVKRSEDNHFIFNESIDVPTAQYVKRSHHYMEYRIPKEQTRKHVNGQGSKE